MRSRINTKWPNAAVAEGMIFLAQLNLVAAAGLLVTWHVTIPFLRRLLNLWAACE
jgi:hypothetical protein